MQVFIKKVRVEAGIITSRSNKVTNILSLDQVTVQDNKYIYFIRIYQIFRLLQFNFGMKVWEPNFCMNIPEMKMPYQQVSANQDYQNQAWYIQIPLRKRHLHFHWSHPILKCQKPNLWLGAGLFSVIWSSRRSSPSINQTWEYINSTKTSLSFSDGVS